MILPTVCIFVLCGSVLFETSVARHLISGEQQTGRDSTGSLRFAHVEGNPQGVKGFSSKQIETRSEPEWVIEDESSATGDEGKNSWEYTGAESDPYAEEVLGSGKDLRDVEERPRDSNFDVENIQDDKDRGNENVESEQSGKTPYKKMKNFSVTKLNDNNNDDDRVIEAGNSHRLKKGLADNVEQDGDSSDGQRVMNDYRARSWVKESAGDINQKNVEDGLINNSYVTHVVESTDDKEQTEDEQDGGDLSSTRFDQSDNAHNFVKPTYDKDQSQEEEDDSSSRDMNTNKATDILESTSRGKDQAELEDKKAGSYSKSGLDNEEDEEGDSDIRNLHNNVATNILQSTSREKDRHEEQREGKGSDLTSGHKEQSQLEDEKGSGLQSKNLNTNVVINILESQSSNEDHPEQEEEEERSDSSSRNLNTSVATNILESRSKDKDQAKLEEKGSDTKHRNVNTDVVPKNSFEAEGRDQTEMEEDQSDSNSAMLSNNTVAQILESSRVTKDSAKEGHDSDDEKLHDNKALEKDPNNKILDENTVTHKDQEQDEELNSDSEKPDENTQKDVVKSTNDNAPKNEKDPSTKDKTVAHIVKSTRDEDQEQDEGLDSDSEKPDDNTQKDVVKSTDNNDPENEIEPISNGKTVAHIVKSTRDEDQEQDEGLDSDSEKPDDNTQKDVVKSTDNNDPENEIEPISNGKTVAHIVKSTQVKDQEQDEGLDSDSEKPDDNTQKDVVKSTDNNDPENEIEPISNGKTVAHIVKSTQVKDQEQDEGLNSDSEKPDDNTLKDVVKSTNDNAPENEKDPSTKDKTVAHTVKSTRDNDQEQDGEKLHNNVLKNAVKPANDKALESEKDLDSIYPNDNTVNKKPNGNTLKNVVKSTDDNVPINKKDQSSNDKTVAHIVKSTRDKNQKDKEEDKIKVIHDHPAAHEKSIDDDVEGEDIVQSARDENIQDKKTKSDSENRNLNNGVVKHDLERTGKAEDHKANDVKKQDDDSKITPSTQSPGGNNHYKNGEYSTSQNMLEVSGDSNPEELPETYSDASKTNKLSNDEDETEEETEADENQDPNDAGYDDPDVLFSGEQSFSDGNQLELASLISPNPGKEGRVARTKIYRPVNQDTLLQDQADDKDIQDAAEFESSPEEFSHYVADDGEQENLHAADAEDERAMGRDLVQRDESSAASAKAVKDWSDSERSGAKENSGLENDYEKPDVHKAAQENLEHSQKTQEILANLENEMYNNGKQFTKQSAKKSRESKTINSKKRIHKLHRKLKLHQGVHKPKIHEKISKFSSSGIAPPVLSPVMMSPVAPARMVVAPTTKFTYHELSNAQEKGAVCIDGSVPRYYFRKGFANGMSKWIIYLQGGAWCESKASCLERSTTALGSSRYLNDVPGYPAGLLSGDYKDNPTFFNWNVVYLPYCDGSSFAGNRSDPVEMEGKKLYFRGKRILSAAMDDLLNSRMKYAKEVVLSGTSAGGLAVMLHNDYIRERLPRHIHLHSLADSGFFLDIPTLQGKAEFRKDMQNVFKLHDCTSGVNQNCVSSMSGKDLWKCIFPQYFLSFVKSPLYVVNPIFDSWQLVNVYKVQCAYHVETCTKKEKEEIRKFGHTAMEALTGAVHSSAAVQMYADACVDHGQVISNLKWNSIKVKDMSISGAFTKWYERPHKNALAKSLVDDTVSEFIKEKLLVNPTCV